MMGGCGFGLGLGSGLGLVWGVLVQGPGLGRAGAERRATRARGVVASARLRCTRMVHGTIGRPPTHTQPAAARRRQEAGWGRSTLPAAVRSAVAALHPEAARERRGRGPRLASPPPSASHSSEAAQPSTRDASRRPDSAVFPGLSVVHSSEAYRSPSLRLSQSYAHAVPPNRTALGRARASWSGTMSFACASTTGTPTTKTAPNPVRNLATSTQVLVPHRQTATAGVVMCEAGGERKGGRAHEAGGAPGLRAAAAEQQERHWHEHVHGAGQQRPPV